MTNLTDNTVVSALALVLDKANAAASRFSALKSSR